MGKTYKGTAKKKVAKKVKAKRKTAKTKQEAQFPETKRGQDTIHLGLFNLDIIFHQKLLEIINKLTLIICNDHKMRSIFVSWLNCYLAFNVMIFKCNIDR